MVEHDIISCNIPIRSVLGHLGSCKAIFVLEGPFLVMKGPFGAVFGHYAAPWASEKGPRWSNMTYNHVIYPWEVF